MRSPSHSSQTVGWHWKIKERLGLGGLGGLRLAHHAAHILVIFWEKGWNFGKSEISRNSSSCHTYPYMAHDCAGERYCTFLGSTFKGQRWARHQVYISLGLSLGNVLTLLANLGRSWFLCSGRQGTCQNVGTTDSHRHLSFLLWISQDLRIRTFRTWQCVELWNRTWNLGWHGGSCTLLAWLKAATEAVIVEPQVETIGTNFEYSIKLGNPGMVWYGIDIFQD